MMIAYQYIEIKGRTVLSESAPGIQPCFTSTYSATDATLPHVSFDSMACT